MADRMSAQIWIGGRLPRSLLEEFPISGLTTDWDGERIDASSEEGILAARDERGLLHFADAEAAWGEFEELEGWLRKHRIPFERQSEGKYDFNPCLVEFRPDLPGKPDRETLAAQEGKPVVLVEEIEKITRGMAKLAEDTKRPAGKRLQAWERLYRKLLGAVPTKLPPLPRFEILEGKGKA